MQKSRKPLQSTPFLRKINEKNHIFNKNINTLRRKKVTLVFMNSECRGERPLQSTSKILTNLNSSPRKIPNHQIVCKNIGLKKSLLGKSKITLTPCNSVNNQFSKNVIRRGSIYFR